MHTHWLRKKHFLNPFIHKIPSVILLIVCFMILLVERIYYWINYQYPKWYFSYSHHLSAWYCIDIVRGNSVTRFKWLDGLEGLWIGMSHYTLFHAYHFAMPSFYHWSCELLFMTCNFFISLLKKYKFPDTIFPKSINVSSPHIIYRSNLWRLTKNMKLWKSWLS